jgi:hypothetical protein
MSNSPTIIFSVEDEDAERQALEAAVAKARADTRPDIPHEEVREEMLREIEELRRKIAASAG